MPINIVYTISLTTYGTCCYSWRPTPRDRKPILGGFSTLLFRGREKPLQFLEGKSPQGVVVISTYKLLMSFLILQFFHALSTTFIVSIHPLFSFPIVPTGRHSIYHLTNTTPVPTLDDATDHVGIEPTTSSVPTEILVLSYHCAKGDLY